MPRRSAGLAAALLLLSTGLAAGQEAKDGAAVPPPPPAAQAAPAAPKPAAPKKVSIKLLTHVAPDLAPIAALARRMGMQVETRTRNGRETLVLRVFLPDMAKPAQLLVETRGCKEGRCPLIQFLFVVRARGLTDAKISAWNLKSVSMFATRLKEDAVLLRRPVLVAGGVTEQNLQAELTMATRDIVGFLRAASEGGARKAQ